MSKDSKTLGQVIKEQREKLGLSQRELARKVNINNATISLIEGNPKIVANPNTLKAISLMLKIDYNYLLSLNNTIEDDKDMRIIARATKTMSEQDRERMMKMLRDSFSTAFLNAEEDVIIDSSLPDDY